MPSQEPLYRTVAESSLKSHCHDNQSYSHRALVQIKLQNYGPLLLLISSQVLMIIKGLCRRYERWNPVHPTYGAFWGMGIGIGCGVGWGPGFGPEVIGYVGAGCGVGFSVGITLAGFGIGLPTNCLFAFPYNAVMATKSGALELFARSNSLLFSKNVGGDEWNNILPCISALQRHTYGKFSCFKQKAFLDKGVDLVDVKNKLRYIWEGFGRFGGHCFRPHKGLKD